jgi:hypothetical protein
VGRSAKYREELANLAQSKQQIDLTPIRSKALELMKKYNIRQNSDGTLDFSRARIDKKGIADAEEIFGKIGEWGSQADDATPIGLDTLKVQLDDFYSESKGTQALVTELRNFVKGQIVKHVPEYAKMTKDYAKVSGIVNEIERALSLNNRAMADTAVKKLLSTTRDNFEFRKELAGILSEMGGTKDLPAKIAGVQMQQAMPQGLMGVGAAGGAVFTGFDPQIVALASITSPRLMGELLNTLGYGRRQISELLKFANKGSSLGRAGVVSAYQSTRPTQQENQ